MSVYPKIATDFHLWLDLAEKLVLVGLALSFGKN